MTRARERELSFSAATAWTTRLALLGLVGCVPLRIDRFDQQVTWSDGDPARVDVWLIAGNWQGPFGNDWGWLLVGDIVATPVLVLGEVREGVEAIFDGDVVIRGGPAGWLLTLLPGFTCMSFDEGGSRWRVLHRALQLPAGDRTVLANGSREQRIAWLLDRYAPLMDAADFEWLRGWLSDVVLVSDRRTP